MTDDELICAYWETLIDHPGSRAVRICATPGASSELIGEQLEIAAADGATPLAERAAAANPGTPSALLQRWAHTLQATGRTVAVLTNPALRDLGELYVHQSAVAKPLLCRNPGADVDWLLAHLDAHPDDVLSNPTCPAEVVHEHLGDHHGAWAHPSVSAATIDTRFDPGPLERLLRAGSISRGDLHSVMSLIRNPNLATDTLERCACAPDTETGGGAARRHLAATAQRQLLQRRWATDPHQCSARTLILEAPPPAVLWDVLTLDDEATDTVRALLRNGFDGTVAELLTVATTLTH